LPKRMAREKEAERAAADPQRLGQERGRIRRLEADKKVTRKETKSRERNGTWSNLP